MYELNEQDSLNNKKSNIKSLLKSLIEVFRKKLNVELKKAFAVEISNLLRQIKKVYKYDDIIQNIIQIKILGERKLSLNIIKNNVKIELEDCKMHKDLLYINDKLYVFNDMKLRTKIIRDIHDFSLKDHVDKSFIYNRLFRHYY